MQHSGAVFPGIITLNETEVKGVDKDIITVPLTIVM